MDDSVDLLRRGEVQTVSENGAKCRYCSAPLSRIFADLGAQPSANAYLRRDQLFAMEPTWPLRAFVCDDCKLVQLAALHTPEDLFGDYAYFSSYSRTWLRHAETFADEMVRRMGRDRLRLIVEIASNDGYLLQFFRRAGIPVLGIEPAANVAEAALAKGLPTMIRFFGSEVAAELSARGNAADLVVANNVLAHVPDLHDFVSGLAAILAPGGLAVLEFPHLLRLIDQTQFDTIYHEHLSYFSLGVVERLFAGHGLGIVDVEELATHGGSLRIFAARAGADWPRSQRVDDLLARERDFGLDDAATYEKFRKRVAALKRRLLGTLIEIHEAGGSIAAYGAPAKGNTLLNFCGIGPDLVPFTVDRNPGKQGRWLPGSRIPIDTPERLKAARPDYLLVLPWNLLPEIVQDCAFIREWGGKFIVPIPIISIIE